MLYNWQYFDKRNRLCHNMVMEHFEVHKEKLEDLILDVDRFGPKILADIPDGTPRIPAVTLDDFALIDELSGLNLFLDNFMLNHDVPETVKQRIRARMIRYSGDKPKSVAMNEMRMKLYGDSRWKTEEPKSNNEGNPCHSHSSDSMIRTLNRTFIIFI